MSSDTPIFDALPVFNPNVRRDCSKGKTRLQESTVDDKAAKKQDEQFRREVYRLDKGICRCCGRKVERKLDRKVDRAEVHHVHGRVGDLRWLVRAALLLCLECHERVTGKVNDRLALVGSKFFMFQKQRLIDARKPVRFQKVA